MNQILGFASLIGFATALIVHIAALMGVNVSDNFPAIWWLHGGIFIVFIPFVFSSRKSLGPKPTFAELRAAFPKWVVGLGLCIAAYALVNFALFMMNAAGGNPSIVDGKFVLLNRGNFIRELTVVEYSTFKVNQVRGFSGHWLVFYFVPFAYFMFHKRSQPFNSTPSARLH
ncbi:hypothetical protein [Janthinobacterium sp. EB271-G4-7A]|uniref:hypothetical protein n=1 Tax=Janthinobacterium sp. EB271-G4-7A TaxID=2775056 RepID=UPI001E36BA97|nr:hypothetical protein [Janthinobacterium sp. EB271-G4-7A]MCC7698749.1 hypothetical protein [Janthinobacterium sp. EB271-G4-7A]